jgi:hypothetical protein
VAFICHVLPDSLAVAPSIFRHAPRFVIAVASRTGAAVLVLFAAGVIGCPNGQAGFTCVLATRIIIIIWDDALAQSGLVTTHAVGGAERLCVINMTGRATRRSAFEPDSLKGLHRGALER